MMFFLIEEGDAVATISLEGEPVVVGQMTKGGYFGEKVLFLTNPTLSLSSSFSPSSFFHVSFIVHIKMCRSLPIFLV